MYGRLEALVNVERGTYACLTVVVAEVGIMGDRLLESVSRIVVSSFLFGLDFSLDCSLLSLHRWM